VKLADLGMADPFAHFGALTYEGGARSMGKDYMSPEQRFGWNLTEKSDIYSLGILLLRLIGQGDDFESVTMRAVPLYRVKDRGPDKPATDFLPLDELNALLHGPDGGLELLRDQLEMQPLRLVEGYGTDLEDLLHMMLQVKEDDRPYASQIVQTLITGVPLPPAGRGGPPPALVTEFVLCEGPVPIVVKAMGESWAVALV
jgi:serine/threonine protein kinase